MRKKNWFNSRDSWEKVLFVCLLTFALEAYIFDLHIEHNVDIRCSIYGNPVLFPIFICCYAFIIKNIAMVIDEKTHLIGDVLGVCGKYSLQIMYIHWPIVMMARFNNYNIYKMLLACLASVIVALLFSVIVSKNKVLKGLFINGKFD